MDLSWDDLRDRVWNRIGDRLPTDAVVWGVPRGGSYIAAMLAGKGYRVTTDPRQATIAVDDIVDSGRTRGRVLAEHGLPLLAAVDKTGEDAAYGWVEFPWEGGRESDAEDTVTRMLQQIGEDATREGLVDTPARVVRSWSELYRGYADEPPPLRWFESDTDEMITVSGISFYSTCEHHMLPFYGTATVSYIPQGFVVGVSKIARVVGYYSARLQIQERLTQQIGNALAVRADEHVAPLGVAVRLKGVHLCMAARGVSQQNSTMETTHIVGVYRTKPEARAEFMAGLRD